MNTTDKGLPELLPCPFCGGQPRLDQSRITEGFSVHCPNCDAAGGWHEGSGPDSAAQTVAAWNRRYLSAASGKAVAEIRWVVGSQVFAPPTGMDALEYANEHIYPDSKDDTRFPTLHRLRELFTPLHPATVTDEDVERAMDAFAKLPADHNSNNWDRECMRAALSSFANKENRND